MISAITIIDNFIFTVISMLRALPSCSHFMTTAKPHAVNLRGERLDHRLYRLFLNTFTLRRFSQSEGSLFVLILIHIKTNYSVFKYSFQTKFISTLIVSLVFSVPSVIISSTFRLITCIYVFYFSSHVHVLSHR